MNKEELLELLIPKERDLKTIAKQSSEDENIIKHLIEGLNSSNTRIKYGSLNTLDIISQKFPENLYEYFNSIEKLLDNDKRVFKLGGIKILCNLSTVDCENHIERIFKKLFAFISYPEMTPASNLIKGSATIIKSKPEMTEKIIDEILEIEKNSYETPECKNILIGQAIETFYKVFYLTKKQDRIRGFVEKNLNHNRLATRKKAEKFIKRYK